MSQNEKRDWTLHRTPQPGRVLPRQPHPFHGHLTICEQRVESEDGGAHGCYLPVKHPIHIEEGSAA